MQKDNFKNPAPTEANNLLGVVYLVNRIDTSEYGLTSIEMAFNTKDKAETYKKLLEEIHKDSIFFQHRFFYLEVEQLSVS